MLSQIKIAVGVLTLFFCVPYTNRDVIRKKVLHSRVAMISSLKTIPYFAFESLQILFPLTPIDK